MLQKQLRIVLCLVKKKDFRSRSWFSLIWWSGWIAYTWTAEWPKRICEEGYRSWRCIHTKPQISKLLPSKVRSRYPWGRRDIPRFCRIKRATLWLRTSPMEGGSEANARNQLKRPPHFRIYTLNSLIQGTVKSKPVGIPVIPVCLQERATFEVEAVEAWANWVAKTHRRWWAFCVIFAENLRWCDGMEQRQRETCESGWVV